MGDLTDMMCAQMDDNTPVSRPDYASTGFVKRKAAFEEVEKVVEKVVDRLREIHEKVDCVRHDGCHCADPHKMTGSYDAWRCQLGCWHVAHGDAYCGQCKVAFPCLSEHQIRRLETALREL